MKKDIRDTINDVRYHSSRLCSDSQRALREFCDATDGMKTMHHLALYEAKGRIDWAYDNIAKIKSEIDAAVELVDSRLKTGCAA